MLCRRNKCVLGYFRLFWDKWDKSGTRGYFGQNSPKVIANMILHPAGGLASSSEGVLTLL